MPLYDYICASCGQRTEFMHGVFAPGPEACPVCGSGPMKKALHAPAVHFKGSGWAKKERAASGSRAGKEAGAAASGSSDGGDQAGAAAALAAGGTDGSAGAGGSGSGPVGSSDTSGSTASDRSARADPARGTGGSRGSHGSRDKDRSRGSESDTKAPPPSRPTSTGTAET